MMRSSKGPSFTDLEWSSGVLKTSVFALMLNCYLEIWRPRMRRFLPVVLLASPPSEALPPGS